MSLGKFGGIHTPIHAPHPSAFHMPKAGGTPVRTHISMPHMPHPASVQVRLPRGEVDTQSSDPSPSAPGVGRF